ncbi:enoyl-CoA hydratase/isomerase family protein [Variovorax sp. SRS16]|uniref:enoyl-CoA hydratase/isomerase family protein n=1 Tax=Variovorax sp. SRS16 TaxID=282217 RepID=UPI0013A595D7|nr:enoyl-CoA hydratase/isomerase family protein [Variovorax sp. SRS16]
MHFETLPGRVGLVTLDRPAALNALDMQSVRLLREGIRAMEADTGIDVIVLTGSGERAFCVGVDLKERQRLGNAASRDFAIAEMLPLFREFDTRAKPAIAAVFGHVIGGGFELVLCCDMIVAADDTLFALPEAKWGLLPGAAGCRKLPGRIGQSRASAMIMAGDRLPAAEAMQLGLVNSVLPRAGLLDEALRLARQVSANVGVSVRAARRCIGDALAAPATSEFDLAAIRECYAADPSRQLAGFGRKA